MLYNGCVCVWGGFDREPRRCFSLSFLDMQADISKLINLGREYPTEKEGGTRLLI